MVVLDILWGSFFIIGSDILFLIASGLLPHWYTYLVRKYWYIWVHGALHIAFFTNEFIIARADTDNKGFIKTISEPSHCVLLVLGIKCSKFIWSVHCEPDTIKNKISKPVKKKRSRLDQNRSRSVRTKHQVLARQPSMWCVIVIVV